MCFLTLLNENLLTNIYNYHNNNVLTNSDFFTNARPAQYGNAISGVFDLKMRSGNNENHEFTGQAGFGGFEIGAEGPLKKGGASYLINYRYSTLSVFNFLGFNIGVGDAVPQYQDLTFKLNIPLPKRVLSCIDVSHKLLTPELL